MTCLVMHTFAVSCRFDRRTLFETPDSPTSVSSVRCYDRERKSENLSITYMPCAPRI